MHACHTEPPTSPPNHTSPSSSSSSPRRSLHASSRSGQPPEIPPNITRKKPPSHPATQFATHRNFASHRAEPATSRPAASHASRIQQHTCITYAASSSSSLTLSSGLAAGCLVFWLRAARIYWRRRRVGATRNRSIALRENASDERRVCVSFPYAFRGVFFVCFVHFFFFLVYLWFLLLLGFWFFDRLHLLYLLIAVNRTHAIFTARSICWNYKMGCALYLP